MTDGESIPAEATPQVSGPGGRLTVYLGYAPGVGKTSRLLMHARDLRTRGTDVVLGWVAPRDRPSAAADGHPLELIPGQVSQYRGIETEDLACDAILARHPHTVVVDDVAHTNAPDARHRRRYQDVIAFLDAGINVLCAFDVQHLESLSRLAERLTGVPVRESIPDSFLRRADDVVLVDLPVVELLERCRLGQIGGDEVADEVLSRLFKPEHLSILRGLAVQEVNECAEGGTGAAMADPRRGLINNPGRVMVCLSSASPRAQILLSKGQRMAGRLNTHWFVVYVETPAEQATGLNDAQRLALQKTLETARDCGAEVVRLASVDPVLGILEFAASHGVRDIIVGRSNQPWWRLFLGWSPVQRLLQQAIGFDVHVISFDEDERS